MDRMSQKERDELEAVFAAICINNSPRYILLFKGFCKNLYKILSFYKKSNLKNLEKRLLK